MRVRKRKLLEEAIEAGLARGYRLAHKHLDEGQTALEGNLLDSQLDAVMLEIDERFRFKEFEGEP